LDAARNRQSPAASVFPTYGSSTELPSMELPLLHLPPSPPHSSIPDPPFTLQDCRLNTMLVTAFFKAITRAAPSDHQIPASVKHTRQRSSAWRSSSSSSPPSSVGHPQLIRYHRRGPRMVLATHYRWFLPPLTTCQADSRLTWMRMGER
jgi:hypothetical protein